ncbi:hypothetical protein EDB84DRAFT_592969 [Lactarius hengduanensis]|nr:hypothetical protein EDB84DRAFT_592969 [Lactarius hengduanensis]
MLLLDLPEEILFVVLESVILPSDSRLSLPDPHSLLTCRTIHRIGLPILYQSILLRTISQTRSVERTILRQPKLAYHIRHLYASALTLWLPVFHAIGDAKGSLQTLDFVFHGLGGNQSLGGGGENAWPPLSAVPVRRLVVRQGVGFLSDRALGAASTLARAIEGWTSLEVAIIEPRLLFLPPHGQPSPLALTLSRSPSLRVLRTPLPPAWNSSLLIASENPSLVRIVLTKPQLFLALDGFAATDEEVSIAELLTRRDDHPWLVEAQKHRRLMRLIGSKQETGGDT